MADTPTPGPAPTDRQQRIAEFTAEFVQVAAATGTPFTTLIADQVARVPHLYQRNLALGQSPAAILDDLAAMLAACAQLAHHAYSPLPGREGADTPAARRAAVAQAITMLGEVLRQPGPTRPSASAWRQSLRTLQAYVTALGLQDAIVITVR